MHMANSEPTMDILDGSDADEDNVGDVDVDQENVLLESDEEEANPSHQLSKTAGGKLIQERGRVEEEEDDVLNIVLQGDEEILDYEGDDNDEDGISQRVPPVKVRSSLVNSVLKEPSQYGGKEQDNDAIANSSNSYDDSAGGANNDDNFGERQYAEDEDYDDGDEETETRTRSRFTSERNVESRSSGNGGGQSGSTSSIQTIQTLGEHKIKPNVVDGRPRHWNYNNNGIRQGSSVRPNSSRHPVGRNHRFPHPRQGPPGENSHMRPILNPPVVQFSEGLFTDFNQPIRHPHQGPRPRQSPPGPPQHSPRNQDPNVHRHQAPPPPNSMNNNMRPNFPAQMPQQQPRPFFPPPPPESQMRHPSRMQPPGPPGHISHPNQSQQPPPRLPPPDFSIRGQRPPRFPPNNMQPHQRHVRPPHMNMNNPPHNIQRPERPPFPPRQQRPPFRPDMPQDNMGMHPQRFPPQQGFPPPQPPHSGPPNFMPPHQHNQHPPRFMGPHAGGPPPDVPPNHFYVQQHGGPGNFNPPPVPGEHPPFQPDAPWHGQPEHLPPHGPGAPLNPNHPNNWHHQHQHHHQPPQLPPQQHQNYNVIGGAYSNPNTMYEPTPPRPPIMHHNPALEPAAPSPIATALQNAHSLELPPITSKSIYIKPNSEIFDALSKGGHFRHLKEDDRRHEGSSSGHGAGSSGTSSSAGNSSKHYDDYDHDHHHHHHYHDRDRDRDRERSSSSRRPASPDRRRDRDEDDYYDDRRKSSYHHYDDRDRDRRVRRKYEDDRDRRHRSNSPERKISRSDNYDRDRARDKEREPIQNKEADKLLEEAKSLGLGEDYVRKLEEQRKLRERILKTKEQRRKLVKTPGAPDGTGDQKLNNISSSPVRKCVENEADSTVASGKGGGNGNSAGTSVVPAGKTKKVLRIVKDKSGKVISKKVHVVVVGKHQDVHQSSATS